METYRLGQPSAAQREGLRQDAYVQPRAYFHVLGPIAVHTETGPVSPGPPLRQALLAVLLAHRNSVVPLDVLQGQLWGEDPPQSARAQIQNHVSGLRKSFGSSGELLRTQRPGYLLAVPDHNLDDAAFRADLMDGRALREAGEVAEAASSFRHALDRWRGPAYDGIDVPAVRAAATDLDELRLDALEDWAQAALTAGEVTDLAAELARELARHPLRERLRGLLMRALDGVGRRAEALRVYQEGRVQIATELGVDPGPELRSLHQDLLRQDGVDSQRSAPRVPAMLPPGLADFTGREPLVQECLDALAELASSGDPAALCLSGQAGIGKTALAVHLAHHCAQTFPDGRILVRLGEGPHAATRALAICLRALGVADAGMPDDIDERSSLLRQRMAERAVLVVLDGATDEDQVRPLLPDAGRSALVVTCRHRLDGIDGLVHRDLPLLPALDALRLLERVVGVDRMRANPDAAAELVRCCDRLPLALRIAAARLAARPGWTVEDLVARLAEEPSRLDWLQIGDRAVRTTFSATCAQLPHTERALFRRLGALPLPEFPAWVAGALLDLEFGRAALSLDRLAEAHLIEPAGRDRTGQRYRMHELLRLFARELNDAEEAPDQRSAAHTRAYDGWLSLARRASDAQPGWIARDPEPTPAWTPSDHVLAAVDADPTGWFATECGAAQAVIRDCAGMGLSRIAWPLAQRLAGFFDRANRVDDWELACESGLAAAVRGGDLAGQACMLRFLSGSQLVRGNPREALLTGQQSLDTYARFDPDRGAAAAGVRLAIGHQVLRELDVAADLALDAVSAARRIGDPTLLGNALHVSAAIYSYGGDPEAALPLMEQALTAYTAAGCEQGSAAIRGSIGLMLKRLGRYAEAQKALVAARSSATSLGDLSMQAHFDSYLAEVLSARGEHEVALRLAAAAAEVQQDSGDKHAQAMALTALGVVTEQAHGPGAALPVLERVVRAWRAAGVSPAVALRRLVEACRAAGDDHRAELHQAELERVEGSAERNS